MTKENEKRRLMRETLRQHEEFLVIGLTGRLGSGCSEAAAILGSSFEQIAFPPIHPGNLGLKDDKERDIRILYRYASHHWQEFDVIRVRTVITSFLLEQFGLFIEDAKRCTPFSSAYEFKKQIWQNVSEKMDEQKKACESAEWESLAPKLKELLSVKEKNRDLPKESLVHKLNELLSECIRNNQFTGLEKYFEAQYSNAENVENYSNRASNLSQIDRFLNACSLYAANIWWSNQAPSVFHLENAVGSISNVLRQEKKTAELDFKRYFFVHDLLPAISDSLHALIAKKSHAAFTELFQKYGNSIRAFGKAFPDKNEASLGNDVYSIPRRINFFIKSLRHPFTRSFAKPTRIAIDSIKSVHESTYLRERYSAFYLIAISCDEDVREERLTKEKNLTLSDIHCIDWNEYSNTGAEKYSEIKKYISEQSSSQDLYEAIKDKLGQDEAEFYRKVVMNEGKEGSDNVRIEAYKNGWYPFVLQDVGASIQNADIFISNNHSGQTVNMDLRWELVRNISLISHPGLLLPTPIERCMQVAFTAKANSGCLSRQVGAVVTDADYNILSIGWNDVPCGDITCARKNLVDLYREHDVGTYSKYELQNKEFRERVNKYVEQVGSASDTLGEILNGLPWQYCFKDIHADSKQSMRSRAMHAEEKALANVTDKAVGGYLFTTSSPCEMCSKNAKNHRIKRIYYIEPYPGISEDQYTNSGDADNRAEHILFNGAIGRAYTQMYTPTMPHKDVLGFLGLPSKLIDCSSAVK